VKLNIFVRTNIFFIFGVYVFNYIETENIVILGFWNTNIFYPDWVKKYLFPDEEINMQFLLNNSNTHRILVDNFILLISPNKLSLSSKIQSEAAYYKIQEIALKISDYLPHTPVNGFGINYYLEIEKTKVNIDKNTLPLIDKFDKKIDKYNLSYFFQYDKHDLTLRFSEKNDTMTIDANFNFLIKNFFDMKGALAENDILFYKKDLEAKLSNLLI